MEAYGLFIFRDALAAMGIPTAPIGLDDHGAMVAELDGMDVPAVLLTPAHHSPHGMPLHPSRRTAVVEWARRTDGYVLDDDYDGEFRYDRLPVGALQALESRSGSPISGSASKSLSPVLRLGWMVLPTTSSRRSSTPKAAQQYYVNGIYQLTMADFIISGGVRQAHPAHAQALPAPPRPTCSGACGASTSGSAACLPACNLLLTLPDGANTKCCDARARRASHFEACRYCAIRSPDPRYPGDGVVIDFGTPAEHAFAAAVDALLDVLKDSALAR